jgi:type II secretory pathway pseudopilin PulG
MIFTLLAGILGAVLIAYLIIKFIPLKLKWLVSLVLFAVAAFLTYAIYQSVMAPIRFNEEKKVKYALVIENLRMIRDAQDAYKTVHGSYQSNPEKLIEFINTGQIAITNSRNILVQVNKGTAHQPIMVEIEQKVVDTTGYNSVKETIFKNRKYENMFNVPGTDKKFELNVGFLLEV